MRESFFGSAFSERLLAYVDTRADDFVPAPIYRPRIRKQEVAPSRRNCSYLRDLGPFQAEVERAFRDLAPLARDRLGIEECLGPTMELEICAYCDGAFFREHVDVFPELEPARVLSFVYYFSNWPRGFAGGRLRLFSWDTAERGTLEAVEIDPDHDTLVVFPSWLEHEVAPVRNESRRWSDLRFSINGWVHRSPMPQAPAPATTAGERAPSLSPAAVVDVPLRWSGRHVAARVGERLLLTHLQSGVRCVLPPHDAEIWRALEQPITPGRLARLMSEQVSEAKAASIRVYVEDLLDRLVKEDFLAVAQP